MARRFLQSKQWEKDSSSYADSFTITYTVDGLPPDFAVEALAINLNGTVTRGSGASVLMPECLSSFVTSIQYNASDVNGIVVPDVSGNECELLFRARNGVRKGAVLAPDGTAVDHDVLLPIIPMVPGSIASNFRVLGSAINGTSLQVTLSHADFTTDGSDGEVTAVNLAVELHAIGQESSNGLTYSPFTIWKTSDFSGTTYNISDMFLSAWYVDQRTDWNKLTLRTGVTDADGNPTTNRQTVYNQLNARQIDDADAKHELIPPSTNDTIYYVDTAGVGNFQYPFPSFAGNAAIQNIPFMSGGAQQKPDDGSAGITGGGKSYAQLLDSRSAKTSCPPYDVQFNNRTASTAYAMIALGYRP